MNVAIGDKNPKRIGKNINQPNGGKNPSLNKIRILSNNDIELGANTLLSSIASSKKVQEHAPAVSQAAEVVATTQIRNIGSLGGNLCQSTRCRYFNRTQDLAQILPLCLKRGGEVCHIVPKKKRCFATYQGDMAAVSEDTGVILWRRKLSSYTGLGADWRQLYITDADDHVWAIDPGNGSALWKNKKMHARMLSAPAVLGEYILVGDFEGYLHWLAVEDGRLLGRTRVGKAPITTTPLVVDGVVYIYGDGGEMAAITVAAN